MEYNTEQLIALDDKGVSSLVGKTIRVTLREDHSTFSGKVKDIVPCQQPYVPGRVHWCSLLLDVKVQPGAIETLTVLE